MTRLDTATISKVVDRHWDEAHPVLEDYIRIPAKSPAFDPDWAATGHIAMAVELIRAWCESHAPEDATVWVQELAGRTPVVVVEVEPTADIVRTDTVLLYGHLDKQPEMTGWREGLGPWTPVLEGDRLYGRGGGDDGYSAFAIMAALDAVRSASGSHQRCIALIEASEESGSPDLPAHLDALRDRLGDISLVVCLDSGAPDYDAMWVTTSLRGLIQAELRVDVLDRGQHSGIVGGAAPSSMRVLRRILDRIEDADTGRILLESFHVDIPPDRRQEAEIAGAAGVDPRTDIAFAGATRSDAVDAIEAQLNICWRPTMASIGMDGVPALADAGNVLRPHTTLGLSFRIPPTCDPHAAIAELQHVVTTDPPSDATVTLVVSESAPGWNAPTTEPWLQVAIDDASQAHFGRSTGAWGIGGSIPFMAMLGDTYPSAQFVITGVLGPESNAHGPNEFLHLPTARRISACVAHILDAHARRP
jgi:acetylornithine deacetylase/succinyl-diaminopimelate desuccinylase-like protein